MQKKNTNKIAKTLLTILAAIAFFSLICEPTGNNYASWAMHELGCVLTLWYTAKKLTKHEQSSKTQKI